MEKPILFSGEMVRAILDGRKTQTRRVIMPQPAGDFIGFALDSTSRSIKPGDALFSQGNPLAYRRCPYGKPGDLLWVRETHWRYGYWEKRQSNKLEPEKWRFIGLDDLDHPILFVTPNEHPVDRAHVGYHKRPSIFMPRWASRLTLRVVDVPVEELWEMSVSTMEAEGVVEIENDDKHPLTPFITLWNAINAKRGYSWDSNPWVWVVDFEVVK